MVLVEIRSVMVLSTGHTTSTRMLSVFANTAVTGGDMAAAGRKSKLVLRDGRSKDTDRIRLTACGFSSVA